MEKLKIMLDEGAYMPLRAHATDAGLDLRSKETKWVYAQNQVMFDTGVHVQLPTNTVGLITSKSGLMSKGLTSRGTIDVGYTGSLKVVLYNHTNEGYLVHAGDKISQLVIVPCLTPKLEVVDSLGDTDRGEGGFGSTGK